LHEKVTSLRVETTTPHNNHSTVLFQGNLGEPVPEKNFWTLWCKGKLTEAWCKGRLTEANTLIIRQGATPSGLTIAHLHHPTTWKVESSMQKFTL